MMIHNQVNNTDTHKGCDTYTRTLAFDISVCVSLLESNVILSGCRYLRVNNGM